MMPSRMPQRIQFQSGPLFFLFLPRKTLQMFLKPFFDRIVSFMGLLLIWPLLLVIALMVRVKIGRPVLFVQERIGKEGKPFKIHKFRTMGAGVDESPVSIAGEERITPLGAKLRHYKLDELPELWDVFIGKMSFVGPRPDVPGYADALTGDDREILQLRPGITGPATLKYRNEEELLATVEDPVRYNDEVIFPDKVRLNRLYLHHRTLWMDFRLLWATVFGRKMAFEGETI